MPLPVQANSDWRYQVAAVSGTPDLWWEGFKLQDAMTLWLRDQNIEHYHQGWYWWFKTEHDTTIFVLKWS